MKSTKVYALAALMSLALLIAILGQAPVAEAGKKRLASAALAALLLRGGKKILLPLPIPVPIPVLRQTQPVYYEPVSYSAPSYDSYSQPSYASSY